MKTISLRILFLSFIGLQTVEMTGFNPLYHGTDAYASYEGMYGKERFVVEDYIKYFPRYQHYIENIPWASSFEFKHLPYPYNTLTRLEPYILGGYYTNSAYITKLFASNNIVNVIEIGSDYGLSTRHIATLLPADGKLYAVDTWDFTNESEYHNQRYTPFLSNVIQKGLTGKIIPVKKASQDAIEMFKLLRTSYDLIYVDGDHATDAVARDLELYYPLLSSHGVICGDDWMLQTVRTGVIQFAQKHQLTIYGACNFWFIKDEGQYQYKDFFEADDSVWSFGSAK